MQNLKITAFSYPIFYKNRGEASCPCLQNASEELEVCFQVSKYAYFKNGDFRFT